MSNKEIIIKLREQTGAGIMDIKEALEQAGNDESKAVELLRKRGQKMSAKRAERVAGEGFIGSYVHSNGKVGAMVKLQCETDFVGRNEDFRELAKDLAMHVTATNPTYIKSDEIPENVIAKEKEIYSEEIKKQGKPEAMMEKIISGKLEKFYEEVCLLNQAFIKDDSKTIQDLINEATAKIGEKIEITEFIRFQI
ncbi:MAG: translation elongation factor Ts [Parcubacteria group bacterium CG_4_9_14_0_2_um_filter_41_8]|nr:MAG: translation elongation factor Ts [Parcubacteria group bacterium CG22_combo_CG10-13_8_21_14_all_41_9]PIQ79145.1 MAG: translation elongation factor Ts [Parcubacteria group bacterium CG11_big_fil_rev_8_21_14_0_20_41_14]PIZ81369.1 MAG: translation elongation factor Ts [Parcubacteria group bacterium CG_4_10_14_0_2_um_filter_41_6]PJC40815.1 MAG: translation elongation factor Ts [Parcubacteria group bacterium CG_4_9_14_0_2_um_filter_41_8]